MIEKGLNLIEKALNLIEKGMNFREIKSRSHGNFSAFDRKRFKNRDYWSENLLKILFEGFFGRVCSRSKVAARRVALSMCAGDEQNGKK